MKTIIAGSRTITDVDVVRCAIMRSGFNITEVVCGMANGPDVIGYDWAKERGIPIRKFPADWKTHGKSAGHIRNREMGDYAEALIAVWDGVSRGTRGMIDYARKNNLKVYVHTHEIKHIKSTQLTERRSDRDVRNTRQARSWKSTRC